MNSSGFGTIIQIGDVLVSEEVVTEFFCCDYPVCRGICCIEGDSGAPLKECELESLERDYPKYSPLMLETGRDAVSLNGFFELDRDGDLVTPLVVGTAACAYAHFDAEGNCLCAIEKCGCTKPSSCSLYPIRITELTGGGKALNLHQWDICKPAFEKGRKEGVRVYQFLRTPLEKYFGKDFYEALDAAATHLLESL